MLHGLLVQFPLRPRIRRRALVASVLLDHSQPPDAVEVAQRTFVAAFVTFVAFAAVLSIPEFADAYRTLPHALEQLTGRSN